MNQTTINLPIDYQPATDLLKDRVILVTGAGQGLGRVAALAYARRGATVILHGRNIPKLEAVYDKIEVEGLPQPAILPLDFAKATQTDLDGFAQAIHSSMPRLDGIFHGASHFVSPMPMGLHDLDVWMQHARVNLVVPAALTKTCTPMLKRSDDASVIFLTETHALQPKAYWGPFAVVKGALTVLTAILADESDAVPNPRFNLCLPGPVASPMRGQSHPGELASSLPLPESLAASFLYLMGPDSAGITGQLLDCQPRAAGL
ncbi:MAG: SDR family NAD(P)-dependent oxidoreductase [Betaproteobacteria bacterium]|nr:SDR family NAD(P)-dependent oxidoreductase [Betaproteobacteria bacterium]